MLALLVRAGNGDTIACGRTSLLYENDTVTITDQSSSSIVNSKTVFTDRSFSLVNFMKDKVRYMGSDCSFNNVLSFQCRISPVYTSNPSAGHYRSFTASHSVYSFKLRGPPALA